MREKDWTAKSFPRRTLGRAKQKLGLRIPLLKQAGNLELGKMSKERIPKPIREEAKEFGGAEKDYRVYERKDQAPGCDKGSHQKRSMANDKRKNGHRKHWRNL